MGSRLSKFYDEAGALGGLKAKMRLAVLTKLPSDKAETTPDSPDMIGKFEQAMQEIKKEF